MIPKELEFLNNRDYGWFKNNSTMLYSKDLNDDNFLQPSDIIIAIHTDKSFGIQKKMGNPLYVFIKTNCKWIGQSHRITGKAIHNYNCDGYLCLLVDENSSSKVSTSKETLIYASWLFNDESSIGRGVGVGGWEFRKLNRVHHFPLLNWLKRNPMDVKG
jgi:hypothetical protein